MDLTNKLRQIVYSKIELSFDSFTYYGRFSFNDSKELPRLIKIHYYLVSRLER